MAHLASSSADVQPLQALRAQSVAPVFHFRNPQSEIRNGFDNPQPDRNVGSMDCKNAVSRLRTRCAPMGNTCHKLSQFVTEWRVCSLIPTTTARAIACPESSPGVRISHFTTESPRTQGTQTRFSVIILCVLYAFVARFHLVCGLAARSRRDQRTTTCIRSLACSLTYSLAHLFTRASTLFTLCVRARYKRNNWRSCIELRRFAEIGLLGVRIFCASRRDKFEPHDNACDRQEPAAGTASLLTFDQTGIKCN